MLYFYADLFMAIFTAYSSAAARLVASIPHRQSWSKNEILFLLIFQLARSDYSFCKLSSSYRIRNELCENWLG